MKLKKEWKEWRKIEKKGRKKSRGGAEGGRGRLYNSPIHIFPSANLFLFPSQLTPLKHLLELVYRPLQSTRSLFHALPSPSHPSPSHAHTSPRLTSLPFITRKMARGHGSLRNRAVHYARSLLARSLNKLPAPLLPPSPHTCIIDEQVWVTVNLAACVRWGLSCWVMVLLVRSLHRGLTAEEVNYEDLFASSLSVHRFFEGASHSSAIFNVEGSVLLRKKCLKIVSFFL